MAAVLEVVLKARDELTGVLKTSELNTRQLAQTASKMKVALGAAFAVGASLAAVHGIASFVNESVNLADQLDRTAKMMQISTEEAQRWNYVAKQNGSSAEALSKGIQQISKNAYESLQGTNEYTKAFAALNVGVKDSNGNLKSSEVLFKETVLALADVSNKTERAALAQKLLGRGGQELLPILSQGKEAILEQLDAAEKYGQILSADTVAKLDDAGDAMDRFKTSMAVAKAEIVVGIAPALTKLADTAARAASKFKDIFTSDINEQIAKQEQVLSALISPEKRNWWQKIFYASGSKEEIQKSIEGVTKSLEELRAKKAELEKPSDTGGSDEIVTDFSGSGDKKDPGIDAYKRMSQEASENAREMFEFTTKISEASRNWAYEDARIRFEAKQNADKQILTSEQVLQDTRIALMANGTEKELAMLDVKYERMKAGYEGNVTALANIDEAYAEERQNITDAVTKSQLEASRNQTQAMIGNLRGVATQWKQFAGVYKAIAIAQTIWDTYSSAQSSYKAMAGIPYVGPALGVAAAASAVAAGLANIAQIKAARFALGGDFITRGPTPIIVGDNAGGVERVQVTPISSPNINGPQGGGSITLQVYDQSGGLVEATRSKIRSGEYDSAIRDIMSRYGMMT